MHIGNQLNFPHLATAIACSIAESIFLSIFSAYSPAYLHDIYAAHIEMISASGPDNPR
jgi:hypothetical protein